MEDLLAETTDVERQNMMYTNIDSRPGRSRFKRAFLPAFPGWVQNKYFRVLQPELASFDAAISGCEKGM